MRLSTKSRYAVTSMLSLAIHDQVDTLTLARISEAQGISLSYLEQLFAKLRKHRLVEGVRGPGGGYRLAKPLDEISVAQIIAAVDEPANVYADSAGKRSGQAGLTHELWDELSGRLYDFLDGITLAEFAERPDVSRLREKDARHGIPKTSAA